MHYFYFFLGIPHLLVYLYYRKKYSEIDEDLSRLSNGRTGPVAFLKALCFKEFRNVFYFRLPLFCRLFLNLLLPRVPDCKIQCEQNLAMGGIRVHHGWGTIVLVESIGKNCDFYQNVTVGYGRGGKPTIGNNVKIYSGAVVAGKIHIGDNVRIAANSVVRHDVPSNSLVYGNPAVVVKDIS